MEAALDAWPSALEPRPPIVATRSSLVAIVTSIVGQTSLTTTWAQRQERNESEIP